jgi:DNA helicase II / ATP-dependent DNA helicase PcrA
VSAAAPGSPEEVLQDLDPEQREVAAHPLGPMVVLAGAGTGKTRAITHRIAYGVRTGALRAPRVLAVTFTARAAGEMRTRLRSLGVPGVQARTFHAAALRQLHFFWPQAVGGPPPEVLAHKAPAIAEAAGRLRLGLDRTELRDVAAEVEWAKVSLLTAEDYPRVARDQDRRPAGLDGTAFARLMQTYQEVTAERHVIDFEDVLLLMVGVLAEHPQVAQAVRQQYRHFVVDEYQDVNPLQQQLLDLWVGEREDVCVVGDPAQTIYSFTGASADHLRGFAARHPGARTVHLVRNYRSTPQVVHLANLVLPGGSGRLRSQQDPGPEPRLTAYPDDEAEARGVASAVREIVDGGVPAASVAVLFRTNAQSEAVESALSQAGVPYLVRGGERFFSRTEVRQAVLLLRGQVRGDDGGMPLGDRVRDVLGGAGWTQEAPSRGGATRERWESLQALCHLADDLAKVEPSAGLRELVAELDRRASEQHAPAVQGVTLASLHAAKGLEWDTVFVVGCSEGLLPISMADSAERVEEERRLLYVGLTRARRELRLSWAAGRGAGGRGTRRISRFLAPAASVLGASAASTPRSRSRTTRSAPVPRVCRVCGTELAAAAERKVGRCSDCPPSYDEATFERLRAWRLQTATDAKVPAFVVFTDATLTAIAERRPGSHGELAGISGVGPRKLDLYGDEVLSILAEEVPGEVSQ